MKKYIVEVDKKEIILIRIVIALIFIYVIYQIYGCFVSGAVKVRSSVYTYPTIEFYFFTIGKLFYPIFFLWFSIFFVNVKNNSPK